MEGPTLAARAGAEMLGSLMTCCLALGAVGNALLPRTKGEGMGLLAIALSVGLGIGLPICCFWRVSAFFNPGILLASAVRGQVGGAGPFFALLGAELAGWFVGALVLYVFYLPHLNAAVALPAADEVDRLLRDPAVLSDVALVNASYTLGAPAVSSQQSFWRFAAHDLQRELGKAWRARKLADPFRTCPEELAEACDTAGYPSRFGPQHKLAPEQAEAEGHRGPAGPAPAAPAQAGAGAEAAGQAEKATGARWSSTGAEAKAELERFSSGGSGPGSPSLGSCPSRGPWLAAAERAELGGQLRGLPAGSSSSSSAASEDGGGGAAAPTYAQRLRSEGGALRSRGHLAAALCKARQDVLLSVFVTRPAVWSPLFNLLQEFIAMTIMATAALLIFEQGGFMAEGEGSSWPPQAGLLVGLLNTAVVLSLGGGTGPAVNPARDLMPRLAFHLLPVPGKGCSEWHYAWVPLLGGMAGGAAAGGLVAAVTQLLHWG